MITGAEPAALKCQALTTNSEWHLWYRNFVVIKESVRPSGLGACLEIRLA